MSTSLGRYTRRNWRLIILSSRMDRRHLQPKKIHVLCSSDQVQPFWTVLVLLSTVPPNGQCEGLCILCDEQPFSTEVERTSSRLGKCSIKYGLLSING